MPARIALRRLGYRAAYRLLQVLTLVARIPRRGVKCAVTDGDLVLLVRHAYGRRSWDVPGGTLRRDEPPLLAARREMIEELGLAGAGWVAIGELRGAGRRRRDMIHCFGAELQAPQMTLDLGEIAHASWFHRDALPADRSRYVDAVLALLAAARPPA